jgi:hypothetical protein
VQRLPLAAQLVDARLALAIVQPFDRLQQLDLLLDVAAQHDVGAAARHVGGDGDHLRPAGLGDDLRLARVLLGVQHLVRQLFLAQHRRQKLGVLDRGGAHQHRLAALVAGADLADDRRVLLLQRAVDEVETVRADHLHVRRHHHRLQAVDLLELVGLGVRRAGHARELAVHAEVVLEGDRGECLVFALDRHLLLGLDRLVQAVGPAPPGHQAPGEFVDDHHLAVLHHVMLVAVVKIVRAQRRGQVVHQVDVGGLVKARALRQQAVAREDLLGLLVARLGDHDLVVLLVDIEVAGRLRAILLLFLLLPRQQRRHVVHAVVELGAVFRLPRDDERRARLVDENRVDLVDDAVDQLSLEALLHAHRHVVAQVVEAELVVGAVGDVGPVGLALVVGVHLRHVDTDREAEKAVDLAHPLGVALGEVVVHRDDLHAVAGQRVQVRRQRGHQRLALAGAHLRDLAVVQHHAAHQLHVEMAHAQRALAGFAHHRERLR